MKMSFEEKQAKLVEIIQTLQTQDNLSLKQMSDLYNQGKKLVEELNEELDSLKSQVSNQIVEN